MTTSATDYFLCGWHVRSEFPLPELALWQDTRHLPDITLTLNEPEFVDPGAPAAWPGFQIEAPALGRLEMPATCTFSVKDGCEIRLRVEPGADPIEVRNFLYGTGLGIICHQRGVFPLHGSCLSLGGRAVIFSGRSGAGKSTLAATLTQRGHTMLSDDVCALEPATEGWSVRPAFPRVKLLPQSLEILPDLKQSGVHAALQGKYHFRFENVSAFSQKTTPLAAIYFLERGEAGEPATLLRKTGMDALLLVQQQVFRRRAGELLGRRAAIFASSGAIVSKVPVYVLRRAFDLQRLQETIDLLEEAHQAVPVREK
ncbi:MAG: hypothetical protein JF584_15015 [Acidobacteria bacterium]|nr:hypothetical protein [Acidobacteriota bacterium]